MSLSHTSSDSVPSDPTLNLSAGETLLPVPAAVEKAIGYRPHPTTCTRWTRHGVGGVKLATAIVGGRPRTTVAAVLEFVRAKTLAQSANQSANAQPSIEA